MRGRGLASQDKNPCPNNCAHTEHGQINFPQGSLQAVLGVSRLPLQEFN